MFSEQVLSRVAAVIRAVSAVVSANYSGFQLSLENNQAITLVLVLLRFPIG